MSYQAVKWAMYDAPMLTTDTGKPDSTARQVLAVLGECASEQGTGAFPSPTYVAYATGLDERTIERALRRLERGGLIARDGIGRSGYTRWKLAMAVKRPASDLESMQARAEETKRVESARRQARRDRMTVDVSGTENAGQSTGSTPVECDNRRCVRHGKCGCPARRMPDVRHGAPPEPPEEPPGNHQVGGTLPPSPLRPDAPPTSGHRNEQLNSLYQGDQLARQPRTTTHAARGTAAVELPTTTPAEIETSGQQPRQVTTPRREGRCPHGRNSRRTKQGQPRCPKCREEPEHTAEIIPFPLASGGSP